MLKGKNAIIIGGSKGIGKSIAKLFAKHGANILIVSRNKENLRKVCEEIHSNGGLAKFIVGDISQPQSMRKVFGQYKISGNKIDILVNNSGIYRENSDTHSENKEIQSVEINLEIVNRLINTNMLGFWWSTKFAEPFLNEGGSIINISSVNGIIGKANSDIYDMTKAGINILTLNQARQFANNKIRVNAICPSSTITQMRDDALHRYLPKGRTRKEFDDLESKKNPLKRLGKSEDIAEMALFLASDKSSYLTGQIISVDGGFLLKPHFFN
jgi:3-oxoacyl-[acyl-carrier protein] reductase